jgi:hypothetical protein
MGNGSVNSNLIKSKNAVGGGGIGVLYGARMVGQGIS